MNEPHNVVQRILQNLSKSISIALMVHDHINKNSRNQFTTNNLEKYSNKIFTNHTLTPSVTLKLTHQIELQQHLANPAIFSKTTI